MTQSNNLASGIKRTASDPLKTLWDALEAGGYEPHGQAWNFRARCPAHDGDNPGSLSVSPGADGRALAHCHAHGCDVRSIVAALGLEGADLFPAGHFHARRREVPRVSLADFTGTAHDVATVLYALDRLDESWRVEIILQCPACGDGGALFVASTRHPTFLSCPNACTAEKVAQALAGRLADRKATA